MCGVGLVFRSARTPRSTCAGAPPFRSAGDSPLPSARSSRSPVSWHRAPPWEGYAEHSLLLHPHAPSDTLANRVDVAVVSGEARSLAP